MSRRPQETFHARADPDVFLFECLNCGALFDSKWHWNEKDPCVVTCTCGTRLATDNDSEGPYVTKLLSTPEHGETCPCASCRKEVEGAEKRLRGEEWIAAHTLGLSMLFERAKTEAETALAVDAFLEVSRLSGERSVERVPCRGPERTVPTS